MEPLPDLVVTPKNNINLGSVVSKVSEPIIKSATTPLSPAVAALDLQLELIKEQEILGK